MKRLYLAVPALALALVASILYLPRTAPASDHQDSPLTVSRPGADITDVFVFPSPQNPNNVVLAMDVWPLIPSGQGATKFFDPGVMYQFKIGLDDDYHAAYVIQFKADSAGPDQRITVYGPAVPAMQGTRSTFVASRGTIAYDRAAGLPGGVRAFAGPREDPFYFDLSQFFKIIPDRNYQNQPNPPASSASCFRNRREAKDFLAGYNVLSLVVEMPRAMLARPDGRLGVVNVWATTSLAESDPDVQPDSAVSRVEDVVKNLNSHVPGSASATDAVYSQVERLARPAVKEATEDFKNHDITNRSDILDDRVLADSIRAFALRPVPAGAGRSASIADALVRTLIPDVIRADLRAPGPARYLAVETNGKSGLPVAVVRAVPPAGIYGIKRALGDPYRHFGGRDIKSPVIDLSLGAIFGSLLPKLGLAHEDNRETPCLSSDNVTPSAKHGTGEFPYLGAPQ